MIKLKLKLYFLIFVSTLSLIAIINYGVLNKETKNKSKENIEVSISRNLAERLCKDSLVNYIHGHPEENIELTEGNIIDVKFKDINGFALSINDIYCFSNSDILISKKEKDLIISSNKKYYYSFKDIYTMDILFLQKKDIDEAWNKYSKTKQL